MILSRVEMSTRASNTVDSLRTSAHDLAQVLSASDVGGQCYHGGRHTCFSRQGRKPIALYKIEELCERCALAWHATMAASLLDQLVIGQRFLGHEATLPAASTEGRSIDPAVDRPWTEPLGYGNAHQSLQRSVQTTAPSVPITDPNLTCPKCGKQMRAKNHLTMHVRHCTGAAKKPRKSKAKK